MEGPITPAAESKEQTEQHPMQVGDFSFVAEAKIGANGKVAQITKDIEESGFLSHHRSGMLEQLKPFLDAGVAVEIYPDMTTEEELASEEEVEKTVTIKAQDINDAINAGRLSMSLDAEGGISLESNAVIPGDVESGETFQVTPEFARDVRLQAESEAQGRKAHEESPEGQAEAAQQKMESDANFEHEQDLAAKGLEYNPFTDEIERTRPMTPEEQAEWDAGAPERQAKAAEFEVAKKAREVAASSAAVAAEQQRRAEDEMNRLQAEAKRLNRLQDKGLTAETAEALGQQKARESNQE